MIARGDNDGHRRTEPVQLHHGLREERLYGRRGLRGVVDIATDEQYVRLPICNDIGYLSEHFLLFFGPVVAVELMT